MYRFDYIVDYYPESKIDVTEGQRLDRQMIQDFMFGDPSEELIRRLSPELRQRLAMKLSIWYALLLELQAQRLSSASIRYLKFWPKNLTAMYTSMRCLFSLTLIRSRTSGIINARRTKLREREFWWSAVSILPARL